MSVFKPEDFGALRDGVTDDTAAFVACNNAAPDGARLLLSPGVYKLTNFKLDKRVVFGGDEPRNPPKLVMTTGTFNVGDYCNVQNLHVQGNNDNPCVFVQFGCYLTNVIMFYGKTGISVIADIHETPPTNANWCRFDNVESYNALEDAFYFRGGDVNKIGMFHCQANGFKRWGINCEAFLGSDFFNIHLAGAAFSKGYRFAGVSARNTCAGLYVEGDPECFLDQSSVLCGYFGGTWTGYGTRIGHGYVDNVRAFRGVPSDAMFTPASLNQTDTFLEMSSTHDTRPLRFEYEKDLTKSGTSRAKYVRTRFAGIASSICARIALAGGVAIDKWSYGQWIFQRLGLGFGNGNGFTLIPTGNTPPAEAGIWYKVGDRALSFTQTTTGQPIEWYCTTAGAGGAAVWRAVMFL